MHKCTMAEKCILITIDVEDWFQVENFKQWIPFSSWDSLELRVERNVHRLLDLFDEMSTAGPTNPPQDIRLRVTDASPRQAGGQSSKNIVRATFFILGWIAQRLHHLVREIHERGHEVASHGFGHELCSGQTQGRLKADLTESKELLENITGAVISGYRAPSFSINDNVLQLIEQSGYQYDSSYNSFRMHGRYGHADFSRYKRAGTTYRISSRFFEIPVSNLEYGIRPSKMVFPWGGGGYFRMIPLPLFLKGVRHILAGQDAYTLYLHPWEIDPDQPKVTQASAGYKFRHYINLSKTYDKLKGLIRGLSNHRFVTCRDYLTRISVEDRK